MFVAHRLNLWHLTALKETIYWFLGTALVLVGSAITAQVFDRAFAMRLMHKAIRFTLIIEFLVGIYVMPLILELVFVPLMTLLVLMQAFAVIRSSRRLDSSPMECSRSMGAAWRPMWS